MVWFGIWPTTAVGHNKLAPLLSAVPSNVIFYRNTILTLIIDPYNYMIFFMF